MTDDEDSFYNTVNVRRFGSLGGEDGMTETMCDAFFNGRSDLEEVTNSLRNMLGEQHNQVGEKASHDFAVSHDQKVDDNTDMMRTPSVGQECHEQDLQRSEEHENEPEVPVVAKPMENLADLTRLAMFGKQRAVLRRSQIKSESLQETVPVPQAKSVQPSRPPVQRGTPHKVVTPVPAVLSRSAVLQKNTPVRIVPCLSSQKNNVSGPITRSRYKELHMTSNAEQAVPAEESRTDQNKNNRSGFREVRNGSDRQARDRTPRSNISSVAAAKQSYRRGPVRIGHMDGGIKGDSFLKSTVVPSEREFRKELIHRNASLGSVRRGLSSTPKTENKKPQSADTSMPSNGYNSSRSITKDCRRGDSSLHRPTSTLKPRASSVSRIAGAAHLPSNAQRPITRSSSATRPLDGPSNFVRSTAQRQTIERRANDNKSISRLTARPPSVSRPTVPKPSHSQGVVARPNPSVDGTRALAPVNTVSTQHNSAGRDTLLQSSAQRNCDHRPSQPRSSVIRHTPARRGAGDGTPLRGFRTELRRYPIPTGATPRHRRPTVVNEFHFQQKHPCNLEDLKSNQIGSTTSTGPSPSRTLSKDQVQAMVDRLAVPKRVTNTTPRNPIRIVNQQTHGLSCVKIRSRSTSLSRRPASAQGNTDVESASRALLFTRDEKPAPEVHKIA